MHIIGNLLHHLFLSIPVSLSGDCFNFAIFASGHVAEKEEEYEEKLWKWQEFQSEMDACFRNLAMIEKSLDFPSFDDAELEDRKETYQVCLKYSETKTNSKFSMYHCEDTTSFE